jgi:hypothetical protein
MSADVKPRAKITPVNHLPPVWPPSLMDCMLNSFGGGNDKKQPYSTHATTKAPARLQPPRLKNFWKMPGRAAPSRLDRPRLYFQTTAMYCETCTTPITANPKAKFQPENSPVISEFGTNVKYITPKVMLSNSTLAGLTK